MFLTKIPSKLIGHNEVMSGFPKIESPTSSPRSDLGILFRHDHFRGSSFTLIQSRVKPSFSLEFQAQTKEFKILLKEGQEYFFKAAINSVMKKSSVRRGREISIPIEDWIGKRDFGANFNIERSCSNPTIERSSSGHKFLVNRVEISGSLIVNNPTLLTASIKQGLGRGTPWGCGLLSVQKK